MVFGEKHNCKIKMVSCWKYFIYLKASSDRHTRWADLSLGLFDLYIYDFIIDTINI